MIIKSKENQLYKFILSLNTKKGRDNAGAFVIEGGRFVREALRHCDVTHVAVSESYAAENAIEQVTDKQVTLFSDALFNTLADTGHSPGILAVCSKMEAARDVFAAVKPDGFYLLVEDVNDPGNLGAIIRAADAAGADAVVLSAGCVELYNPKVLRGSAGSAFHLPVVEGADLTEVIRELKRRGVSVYAAHLAGAAYPYGMDLTGNCAFVVGNEARGLRRETADLADAFVKLPMVGGAESLNAAVAAGVLLYEVVRQRVMKNG
jgi:TrmH family RNA methyltransferase